MGALWTHARVSPSPDEGSSTRAHAPASAPAAALVSEQAAKLAKLKKALNEDEAEAGEVNFYGAALLHAALLGPREASKWIIASLALVLAETVCLLSTMGLEWERATTSASSRAISGEVHGARARLMRA